MSLQIQFNNKILPKRNALFACQNKTRWCGLLNDIEDGSEALPSRRDNQFLIYTAKNRVYFSGGLHVSKFWIIHVPALMPELPRLFEIPLTGLPPCKAGLARIFSLNLPWKKQNGALPNKLWLVWPYVTRSYWPRRWLKKVYPSQTGFSNPWPASMVSGWLRHEAAFWPFIPLLWIKAALAVARPWISTCKNLPARIWSAVLPQP